MRVPLVVATVAVGALATLNACSSDTGLPPAPEPTFSAQTDDEGTLVVDNDRADCPRADFTTIQAAVLAARPGDKILVCRGVYPENVLVEKAGLRIKAHAAPGEVVLQGPGARAYGFHVRNTTGVLLQGFTVRGYADANIIVDGGSRNTLRKNVTTAGVIDGIEVLNSSANVIEENVSFANEGPTADDIFVSQRSSYNNIIRHNETSGNGQHGINLFQTGAGNVVIGNRSHHNRNRGIQAAQQSDGNAIEHNHVFANGGSSALGAGVGILILNSARVTVANNRSENNGSNGIALNGASRNVVRGNRSDGNTVAGIGLNGASDNLLEKNATSRNGQDGVRIANASDRNIVRLNLVLRHTRDGIRVVDAASDENRIEWNAVRESGEHDAHDDSVGPRTGGTANFWIKNHCKTQNRPGLCARSFETHE